MKTVVKFYDYQIFDLDPTLPIDVGLRLYLVENGIKFENSNKLSFLLHKDPRPLGKLTKTYCYEERATIYTQILEEEDERNHK